MKHKKVLILATALVATSLTADSALARRRTKKIHQEIDRKLQSDLDKISIAAKRVKDRMDRGEISGIRAVEEEFAFQMIVVHEED